MSYSLQNRRVQEAWPIPRIQPRRGFPVAQDERSLLGQFGPPPEADLQLVVEQR